MATRAVSKTVNLGSNPSSPAPSEPVAQLTLSHPRSIGIAHRDSVALLDWIGLEA